MQNDWRHIWPIWSNPECSKRPPKDWKKSNERILVDLFFFCYSYRFWKLRTRPPWRLPIIDTFMRSSDVLLKYSSLLGDFSPEKHRGLMFMKALYAYWLLQIHSPFKVYCTILKTKNLIVNTTIQEDNRVKQAIKVFCIFQIVLLILTKRKSMNAEGSTLKLWLMGNNTMII